ncbi:MAG: DUF4317 domain-containing protein [Lachnospiraceae bacterium]|nr:DUF4317 domain-containing protein [Lachnospiraceae bacterium]
MYKSEVSEIKKLFTPKNCAITRICGCYVDGEKNKKATFKEPFLSLPEEDMFKYFEIFRKSLSGQPGKNQLNLEFPLSTEMEGGTQNFLLNLRDSKLKDDALLEQFYDRIIENYDYVGNYLILVIHDAYDVPGKTKDGIEMEDASDEVYEYILTTICPVNLSKPGLSYNAEENNFTNRLRDWVVDMPDKAFLFPAFNDRRTDIHSLLYYSKDAELLGGNFAFNLLGCELPLSAGNQKDAFTAIIENTLEETCSIEAVKNIHEKLNEMVEEHKDEPEPLSLDKNEVKKLLAGSGVSNEKLEKFDDRFDEDAGDDTTLIANNVMNRKSFDVKTPDVVIKVKGDKTNLLQTKIIDGREFLVIALEGDVEVNGITIKRSVENEEEEL